MKKIILVPASFKGTMSSTEICAIMARAIHRVDSGAEVLSIPVADGGEGTVDAFLAAMGGKKVRLKVKGPYFEDVQAFYGLIDDGKTAVIEMAAAAGLPLVGANRHAEKTTTYGVGEMMAHALERGCKKLIVGLGGSATNDLGAGAAAALGVKFFDSAGKEFIPVGETLGRITKIDRSGLMPEVGQAEIISMTDIDNPLYGKHGAAVVFALQKGADDKTVKFLDNQLRLAADVIKRDLKLDVSKILGGGAAGGMGAGMVAFFGSKLQMGIDTILDVAKFEKKLSGADLVITGEGKIDTQSLRGKAVIGVARRAKRVGVPVVAIVGDIGERIEPAYDEGVTGIFSINRRALPVHEARLRAREDMEWTVENLMRFLKGMNS